MPFVFNDLIGSISPSAIPLFGEMNSALPEDVRATSVGTTLLRRVFIFNLAYTDWL